MILPKISAAILSMATYGSAYAVSDRQLCISFEQWVVMAGATNGAACVFGVERDDANLHRMSARQNFTATPKNMVYCSTNLTLYSNAA